LAILDYVEYPVLIRADFTFIIACVLSFCFNKIKDGDFSPLYEKNNSSINAVNFSRARINPARFRIGKRMPLTPKILKPMISMTLVRQLFQGIANLNTKILYRGQKMQAPGNQTFSLDFKCPGKNQMRCHA